MSKFDDAIAQYRMHLHHIGETVNEPLLRAVTKALGPSIYNTGSQAIAFDDDNELHRIRKSFLIKKLGMADNKSLDDLLQQTLHRYALAPHYRAVIYYLLVCTAGKEAVYL